MNPVLRMTLIAVLLFMSRGFTGPVASLYASSLGANYVLIGLLGTVTSLSMIVGNGVWGWLSDRIQKRKPILLVGLGALALGSVALSQVRTAGWLFPLYLWMALAQSAYSTASLALMGDILERDRVGRGRRMGTYRGLGSLGFGATAFFSGMLADAWSLRGSYLLAAGALGVALILALGVRRPPAAEKKAVAGEPDAPSDPGKTPPRSDRVPLPLPPLLIAVGIWSLATGAVYAVWANYMVESLQYSQGQMTRLWGIASLSELPLMILAGWLGDRLGRLPMLGIGLTAWTGVFAGYLLVPSMPWIVGVQLLRGFAYSAHTATAMTYAAEVRDRAHRGRISGLYGVAGAIGGIVGTSLGGVLTEYGGFRLMIGASTALVFAGALYLSVAALAHRRRVRERLADSTADGMVRT